MTVESNKPGSHSDLVAQIVSSYVRHHSIPADQLAELIKSVHRSLGQLGRPEIPEQVLTPAVPVRRSVQPDHVVCLECGWRGKMLRRHLNTRHHLSGEAYLKRWNLPSDHPLTAPDYSEQRSGLAKQLGLGRARSSQGVGLRAAAEPRDARDAKPAAVGRRRRA